VALAIFATMDDAASPVAQNLEEVSSRLLKNPRGSVFKGRGSKPRRKSRKINCGFSAEGTLQAGRRALVFQSAWVGKTVDGKFLP
jgi:hypothetical protein